MTVKTPKNGKIKYRFLFDKTTLFDHIKDLGTKTKNSNINKIILVEIPNNFLKNKQHTHVYKKVSPQS